MKEVRQRKTNARRFHLHVESKTQTIKQNRNRLRYGGHFAGCQIAWGLGEKGEGIEKHKLVVTE